MKLITAIVALALLGIRVEAKDNEQQRVILINSPHCPAKLIKGSLRILTADTPQHLQWADDRDVTLKPKVGRTSVYLENLVDSKENKVTIEAVMLGYRAYNAWNTYTQGNVQLPSLKYNLEHTVIGLEPARGDTRSFSFDAITAADINLAGKSDWRNEPEPATLFHPFAAYTSIVWVEKVRLSNGHIWTLDDHSLIISKVVAEEGKMRTHDSQ